MSEVIYGQLSSPVFGCTTEATVIVNKSELSTTAQVAKLANEVGDIVAAATYGVESEYNLEFTVKAAAFPSKALAGATFTSVGNNAETYIVTEVVNTYTEADWLKGSLKGFQCAGITHA